MLPRKPKLPLFRPVVLMSIAACLFVGCGDDVGPTYHLSGKVTFDGKPIPAGRIMFTPDSNKENKGAIGFATIKDGTFDTNGVGGKPRAAGAVLIRIEGMEPDGAATTDPEDPSVQVVPLKPMFSPHVIKAELPAEDSTQDFDVPASAAQKKDLPEDGNRGGV